MNSVLLYFSVHFILKHHYAIDIKSLSKGCGGEGWFEVYQQNKSLGGFPTSSPCWDGRCDVGSWFSRDFLMFSNLDQYKDENGAIAFTMVWDDEWYIQWDQGENPVKIAADAENTWKTSSHYYSLRISDNLNQHGQMDFNGLALSKDVGVMFDGRSTDGAWFAVGVSSDLELMKFDIYGIPAFKSISGRKHMAYFVQLYVWLPYCGNWRLQMEPSLSPTFEPTPIPTYRPSMAPTDHPTWHPTDKPTHVPTFLPSPGPTNAPTRSPTSRPTFAPTPRPTTVPSNYPTSSPTTFPTKRPTEAPTPRPSDKPTWVPTPVPTQSPTNDPSPSPTWSPSRGPTRPPTFSPSPVPSESPTVYPTDFPTFLPSPVPTSIPSTSPTNNPTFLPSPVPTFKPSTPPTSNPSEFPTGNPTPIPTEKPTRDPTPVPTTLVPTNSPTNHPSDSPTHRPTMQPTDKPTVRPTDRPTSEMEQVVKVKNDAPTMTITLILIITAALLLCIALLCFMCWLSMTKKIPRFSMSESYREKKRKKFSKNIRYETESESEYEVRKKKPKKQSNRIELYVKTRRSTSDSQSSPLKINYQGGSSNPWTKGRGDHRLNTPRETESSITDGTSIREVKNVAPIYVNELEQISSRPKLLWSALSRSAPSNSVPVESSDSEQDSVSPIVESIILQDPPIPSPVIISEEIHTSPVKNALSDFLTPRDTRDTRDTMDLTESEFCKARETRQVSSRVLFSPIKNHSIEEPVILGFSSSEYSKEGENSNSDEHDPSVINDLPKQISLLDIDRNFTTGPAGEKNPISVKYLPRTSPGEDIMRRKTSDGLNSLGIADSFRAEPVWKDGEAAEDHYVFGSAFQPDSWSYETKGAEAELNRAKGGHQERS